MVWPTALDWGFDLVLCLSRGRGGGIGLPAELGEEYGDGLKEREG